jgi:2-polyprenyl-6-methoxyphenol hydroxylase-like FAD-dependent oxidoreductase
MGISQEEYLGANGTMLHDALSRIIEDWHPALRQLVAEADIPAIFPVSLRSAEPLNRWQTTNVTLLGDAVHTMSPARGLGANTALRDAELLRNKLVDFVDGKPLLNAVAEYESEMLQYAFLAVADSKDRPLFRRQAVN